MPAPGEGLWVGKFEKECREDGEDKRARKMERTSECAKEEQFDATAVTVAVLVGKGTVRESGNISKM